jgi:hypothetical protein
MVLALRSSSSEELDESHLRVDGCRDADQVHRAQGMGCSARGSSECGVCTFEARVASVGAPT